MCVPAALVLACDADARLFREVITDPGHVLHKHLPEARQINCNLRPVPMGLDYPLRMTGTLFPGYFSRTCINLVPFNHTKILNYSNMLQINSISKYPDSAVHFNAQ